MEAQTIRGTKLNMVIKGRDFSPLSKSLLFLHQQARDVVNLSLREQEIILANSRRARKWDPIETHNREGNPFPDYSYTNLVDFKITEDNEEEITDMMKELTANNGPKTLAKEAIKLRKALRAKQEQYLGVLRMFTEAKDIAKILKSEGEGGITGAVDIHWDLLQVGAEFINVTLVRDDDTVPNRASGSWICASQLPGGS